MSKNDEWKKKKIDFNTLPKVIELRKQLKEVKALKDNLEKICQDLKDAK